MDMSPANTELARFNMVEQQIRPWDVHDAAVLDAIRQLRREDFVPEAYQGLAFSDIQIPLTRANGEAAGFMLEPKLAGRMLQALGLNPEDRVLQVGAGNGYTAALLSMLVREVVVVEADGGRIEQIRQQLAMAGVTNVTVAEGDATAGWPVAGEVDAILLRGAVPSVSESLLAQLACGGRLVAVVGTRAPMELMQYQRDGEAYIAQSLIDTSAPTVLAVEGGGKEFVF